MTLDEIQPGSVVYVMSPTRDGKKFYICIRPPTPALSGKFLYVNSEKKHSFKGDYPVDSGQLNIKDRGPKSIISFSALTPLSWRWIWLNLVGAELLLERIDPLLAEDLFIESQYHRDDVSNDDADLIAKVLKSLAAGISIPAE